MIQQGFQPKPGPSSTSLRKDSTEDSDDDEDDSNDDENDSQNDMKMTKTREIKFVPTDEDEEESGDSSDEELRPLKAQISPKNAQISPTTSSKDQGKANKSKTGSSKTSTSSSPKAIYKQSNKVDSSGLQATPPHPNEGGESDMAGNGNQLSSPELSAVSPPGSRYDGLDTSGSTDGGTAPSSSTRSPHKRKRKRNADELIKQDLASGVESDDSDVEMRSNEKSTKVLKTFSEGELVWGPHGTFPSWPGKLVRFERDGSKVLVCWFGNRETSQVNSHYLKSLSDGLEDHHRERKKLRKGRKMNAGLEKAIQEAMMELDRMTDD